VVVVEIVGGVVECDVEELECFAVREDPCDALLLAFFHPPRSWWLSGSAMGEGFAASAAAVESGVGVAAGLAAFGSGVGTGWVCAGGGVVGLTGSGLLAR
jgi:hypothetical protein